MVFIFSASLKPKTCSIVILTNSEDGLSIWSSKFASPSTWSAECFQTFLVVVQITSICSFFFFASWCTWWLHFEEHFLSSEYYPPLCPEHECTPYYRLAITNTCPCFTHMVVISGPLTQRDRMIQHSDNLWNLLCTCYSQALLYTLG